MVRSSWSPAASGEACQTIGGPMIAGVEQVGAQLIAHLVGNHAGGGGAAGQQDVGGSGAAATC